MPDVRSTADHLTTAPGPESSMRRSAAPAHHTSISMRGWLFALLPLLLLAALLVLIVRSGPADLVRGSNFPPVERLAFGRPGHAFLVGALGVFLDESNTALVARIGRSHGDIGLQQGEGQQQSSDGHG